MRLFPAGLNLVGQPPASIPPASHISVAAMPANCKVKRPLAGGAMVTLTGSTGTNCRAHTPAPFPPDVQRDRMEIELVLSGETRVNRTQLPESGAPAAVLTDWTKLLESEN